MFRSNQARSAQERIQEEIREINQALDELRRTATRESRDHYDELKNRIETLWKGSREHLAGGYGELRRYTRSASRHASECVREHPVASIALGVGACALIGWLLTRR